MLDVLGFIVILNTQAAEVASSRDPDQGSAFTCPPSKTPGTPDANQDTHCLSDARDEAVSRVEHSVQRADQQLDQTDFTRRVRELRFWMSLAQARYSGPYAGRGATPANHGSAAEWFASGLEVPRAPTGLPGLANQPFDADERTRARAVMTTQWQGIASSRRSGRTTGVNDESRVIFARVQADAWRQIDLLIRQDPRLLYASNPRASVRDATTALKAAALKQIASLKELDVADRLNPAVLSLTLYGPAVEATVQKDHACCASFARLATARQTSERSQKLGEAALALGAGASCVGASLLTAGAATIACALTSGSLLFGSLEGYMRQQSLESLTYSGLLGQQATSLKDLRAAHERANEYLANAGLSLAGGVLGVAAKLTRAGEAATLASTARVSGAQRQIITDTPRLTLRDSDAAQMVGKVGGKFERWSTQIPTGDSIMLRGMTVTPSELQTVLKDGFAVSKTGAHRAVFMDKTADVAVEHMLMSYTRTQESKLGVVFVLDSKHLNPVNKFRTVYSVSEDVPASAIKEIYVLDKSKDPSSPFVRYQLSDQP